MNLALALATCLALFAKLVKAQIQPVHHGDQRQDVRHLFLEDKVQAFNKEVIHVKGFDFLQKREARAKRGIYDTGRDNAFAVDPSEGSGDSEDSFKQPFGKILILKTGADYQQVTTKQRAVNTVRPSSHARVPSANTTDDSGHEVAIKNIFQKVAKQEQVDPKKTTSQTAGPIQTFKYRTLEKASSNPGRNEKQPLLIDEELDLNEEDDDPHANAEEAEQNQVFSEEDETSGDASSPEDSWTENVGNEENATVIVVQQDDELFVGSIILNVMTAAPPDAGHDIYRDRKSLPRFNKDQLSSIPHGVAMQFLQTYCAAIVSAILAVTTLIVLCYIFYMYRQRSRVHKLNQKAEKAVVERRVCSVSEDSPSVLNLTSDTELLGLHDDNIFDSPVFQPRQEATTSHPPPPPPLPRN